MNPTLPPDWPPCAARENLQRRTQILQRLRAFFAERGVLEVETPILSAATATDPQLHSLTTRYTGPGAPAGRALYLHTSPEFPMKRLNDIVIPIRWAGGDCNIRQRKEVLKTIH